MYPAASGLASILQTRPVSGYVVLVEAFITTPGRVDTLAFGWSKDVVHSTYGYILLAPGQGISTRASPEGSERQGIPKLNPDNAWQFQRRKPASERPRFSPSRQTIRPPERNLRKGFNPAYSQLPNPGPLRTSPSPHWVPHRVCTDDRAPGQAAHCEFGTHSYLEGHP